MNYTAANDAEVIRGCQCGDELAYAELYTRYKQTVLGFAWSMLRDYDAALDILQEVFRYLFRRLPTYTEAGKFRCFLHKVTRSLCINELKKRKKIMLTEFDEPNHPVADASEDVDTGELRARLAHALDQLPAHYREILHLRLTGGMSYEDIAAVVELPIGTIKSRIHNGMEKLTRSLHVLGKQQGC